MTISRFWCALVVMTVLLACASLAIASDTKVLWESREQFVKIESQDALKDKPKLPNEHPADISQERLGEILSAIELTTAENKKPVPLFTKSSLENLVPLLQDGLRQASANEDVTFAVIGLYTSAYGFAKSPRVVSGRVFYQGGKLNLIIGKAQELVNERQDRRLYPFTPGSRRYPTEEKFTLLPQPGQMALTMVRQDWVSFDNNWKPVVVAAPVVEKGGEQAAQPSAINKLFSSKSGKVAERLNVLKELRDKGVITEEEYRGKRLTILNEL
ncbi:MAG: SHOCT domain-containing protein [Desulfuromonadales bacterium]|nr:SHOCT domain-containing protein [Desulfuromonadales bacterium]